MPGELGQLHVRAAGPVRLELATGAHVQPRPLPHRQALVRELAEEVVHEQVGAGRVPGEHARPRALGERLGHRLRGLLQGPCHQIRPEPPADDGGGAQGGRDGRGQGGEPFRQRLTHTGRDPRLPVFQQPRHLLHEERVAAGPAVDGGGDRVGRPLAEDVRHQLGHRPGRQPGERERRGAGGHRRQCGAGIGAAVGPDDR